MALPVSVGLVCRRFAQWTLLATVFLKSTTTPAPVLGTYCWSNTLAIPNAFTYSTSFPVFLTGTSAIVKVKVAHDFVTALIPQLGAESVNPPVGTKYVLTFGANNNNDSYISYQSMNVPPLAYTHSPNVLDANKFVTLWVSWNGGQIAAGMGPIAGQNVLMEYADPSPTPVKSIAFGSNHVTGTIAINYCWAPRVFDRMFPTDTPSVKYAMSTDLDCGRKCEDNPKCQGYAVERGVSPVAIVECSVFYSLSSLQFDDQHVLYVVRNFTLMR